MTDWHHAPIHRLSEPGAFIVTAGTYQKLHHFRSAARLTLLETTLKDSLGKHDWSLQAWAVFSNHYHLIATSPRSTAVSLRDVVSEVHERTGAAVNSEDSTSGRQV